MGRFRLELFGTDGKYGKGNECVVVMTDGRTDGRTVFRPWLNWVV